MDSKYVDNLIDDDEVPELTDEDFAQMIPFDELPPEQQKFLQGISGATICPDSARKAITLVLSSDVLEPFTATGEGWEARVDAALRQWLQEHPLPLAKAG